MTDFLCQPAYAPCSVDGALRTFLAGALRRGQVDAVLLPDGRGGQVARHPREVFTFRGHLPGKQGVLRDAILSVDRSVRYAVVLLPCDAAWLSVLVAAGKVSHISLVMTTVCRDGRLSLCRSCQWDGFRGADAVLSAAWLVSEESRVLVTPTTDAGIGVLNGCVDAKEMRCREQDESTLAWHLADLRREQRLRRHGPPSPVGPGAPRPGRKLRVGFITPSLYWGGAERWMLDLARMSTDLLDWVGCACVTTMYRDRTMVDLFEPYMPVYSHGRDAVQQVAAKADVLVSWGSYDLDAMVYGYTGPVVFVSHGCGQFDRNAARSAILGATHLAAVAETATEPLRPYARGLPIEVLHNGIDPARCVQTESRESVRRRLGVGNRQFLVGYLGRMSPEKNPTGIAKAVSLLPRKFRALFVGGGTNAPAEWAEIREILGKRALFVDRTEAIGDYYRAMDCFCLLSPREGFSMAMLEAMHCGVPCVLTNVGVLPELEAMIGRHWESIPFGDDTEKCAAEAIRGLARLSRQERDRICDECRTVIGKRFTGRHMVERWVEYLNRIVPEWYSRKPERRSHAACPQSA